MLVTSGDRAKGSGLKGVSFAKPVTFNLNPCQRLQCANGLVNRLGRETGLALCMSAQRDRGRATKMLFVVGREPTHMDKAMLERHV